VIYRDRHEAGVLLARRVAGLGATLVVALPRGGVIVGYELAKQLQLPLDIVCPRKIGAPGNPEFAIGAIAESGHATLNLPLLEELGIAREELEPTIAEEQREARRRVELYRKGLPRRHFSGETILLVDDGIATGSTMRAAVESVRTEGAKRVILAIPVGPREEVERLSQEVDQCVCLSTPTPFYAIGLFYRDFSQTTDDEVIDLLQKTNPPL
jgi:putative phosphoribosyl transferase